jgi:hypothetical protein
VQALCVQYRCVRFEQPEQLNQAVAEWLAAGDASR